MDSKSKTVKYERTRILSARTLQIGESAPIYVKPKGADFNSYDIAKEELSKGKMPLKVVRRSVKELYDKIEK